MIGILGVLLVIFGVVRVLGTESPGSNWDWAVLIGVGLVLWVVGKCFGEDD